MAEAGQHTPNSGGRIEAPIGPRSNSEIRESEVRFQELTVD